MLRSLFGQLELLFAPPVPEPSDPRRQIRLGSRMVPYELVRARRRSLGITIDHRGMRVGAPRSASLREIERFLVSHEGWVLSKLDEWHGARPAAPFAVTTGALLPVLGEPVRLVVRAGSAGARWRDGQLFLDLTPGESPRDTLIAALKRRALSSFEQSARALAPGIPVELPKLALSDAQTRWGSCNRRTGIRLSWRLVHLEPGLVDYVVAHELAHLVEMNHSRRFWAVVERVVPEYRAARAALRRAEAHLPRI